MKRTYSPPQVTTRPRERCLVDGCTRLEELVHGRSAGGLCAAHRKRKQREQPLEPPIDDRMGGRLTPRQLLLDAALAFADADAGELDGKLYTLLKRARIYGRARRGRVPSN